MTSVVEDHTCSYVPGVAPIRAEFIIATERTEVDDDAAESHTGPVKRSTASGAMPGDIDGEDASKPKKLKGGARKKAQKEEATAARRADSGRAGPSAGGAQNKKRKFQVVYDGYTICNSFAEGLGCQKGVNCPLSHDAQRYLGAKSHDIHLPEPPTVGIDQLPLLYGALWGLPEPLKKDYLDRFYTTTDPFVTFAQVDPAAGGDADGKSPIEGLDTTTVCPLYHATTARKLWDASSSGPAYCPYKFRCRLLGGHIRKVNEGEGFGGTGVELAWLPEATSPSETGRAYFSRSVIDERNIADPGVAKSLRQRTYEHRRTKAVLNVLDAEEREYNKTRVDAKGPIIITEADLIAASAPKVSVSEQSDDYLDALMNASTSASRARAEDAASSQTTSSFDRARIRRSEKRKLDWYHGELYLAPLTTTGNLPFRRICATFGSDIHCGEMGLAASYMEGNKSEWSLARRWEGEKTFGIQLCGNKPDLLVPTAEVMAREFGPSGGLDFVDINCGCPIDMVFQHGGGSALLDHPRKLGRIVRGMDAVLGDIPVTVKLRTGVTEKRTSHHRIMPRVQTEWGAAAVTIHGRSRKQRYSKRADWNYIKECADELRQSVVAWNEESKTADEEEMRPIPVYGNGDVYSQQKYYENIEKTGVDGEMLARGALIKPWLFTEINERRDWDISSRERLDIVRQFAHYGLTHWGSDTQGVNKTRRFLCEAMSFWHRYIPLGILEHVPPSMNDRPPAFRGRDDLETLLASDNKADWVKVSEMFLGRSPSDFDYVPKHKSNSYGESAEQQG